MPEISRFFGIIIRMFYSDHEPAHFHAIYGEDEVLIEIETLALYRGTLPRRALGAGSRMGRHSSGRTASRLAARPCRRGSRTDRSARLECKRGEAMSLLRITTAEALSGFRLRLVLTDGSVIERDVAPLLSGPVFEQIRSDPAEFARVRAEAGSVVWPNGADLCPDVLIWRGPPPESADEKRKRTEERRAAP
jgi:hypothetical protein